MVQSFPPRHWAANSEEIGAGRSFHALFAPSLDVTDPVATPGEADHAGRRPDASGESASATRFGRAATVTTMRQVLSTLVGVLTTIAIARGLGASGSGTLALLLTTSTIAAQLAATGLSYRTARSAARGGEASDAELGRAIALRGVIGGIGVFATLTLIDALTHSDPIPRPALAISMFLAPVLIALTVYASRAQGREDYVGFNMGVLAGNFGTAALLAIVLVSSGLTITTAAACHLAGNAAATAYLALRAAPSAPAVASGDAEGLAEQKRESRAGIWSWAATVINLLLTRVDVYLLAALSTTASLGVYGVAVMFAEKIALPATAVTALLMARLTRLRASGQPATELLAGTSRAIVAVSGCLAIAITILAHFASAPLFGEEFAGVSGAVAVLAPGIVALALSRVLTAELGSRAVLAPAAAISGVTVALNIAANFAWIPRWGEFGAAAASTIAYSLAAILHVAIQVRVHRVSPLRFLVPRRHDFAAVRAWLR